MASVCRFRASDQLRSQNGRRGEIPALPRGPRRSKGGITSRSSGENHTFTRLYCCHDGSDCPSSEREWLFHFLPPFFARLIRMLADRSASSGYRHTFSRNIYGLNCAVFRLSESDSCQKPIPKPQLFAGLLSDSSSNGGLLRRERRCIHYCLS
jgi:hypothetical protein